VLDGQVVIGREFDILDWSPDRAQQAMEQAITALGREAIIGVCAANDGTAAGAIAALKGAGFATLPPVTGQDADLAAVQRILAGEQAMTVYKAFKPQARIAAEMAIAAATGVEYRGAPTQTVSNGSVDVPSVLLEPVVVTRENVAGTIIAEGFYTTEQVCATEYRQACRRAGIS
jgi:D-xylose transport system substrate-binding protein